MNWVRVLFFAFQFSLNNEFLKNNTSYFCFVSVDKQYINERLLDSTGQNVMFIEHFNLASDRLL